MDDESISTAEEIAGQVEGSAASFENATWETPTPKLVPEHDLLAVKDKAQRKENELKARIKELEAREAPKGSPELEDLKAKYQWVDADFLDDVAKLIEKKAEEKLAPVRNQQKQEENDRKWNAWFNAQLALAEWVDKNKVDPELIKTLALSPKYRDSMSVKDIIEKVYKVEPTGRATTENDMRPAMDLVTDVADIDNLTNEQKKRIFADPKARQKYMDAKYQ